MSTVRIKVQPLTAEAFAPFGSPLGPTSTPADFGEPGAYDHWYGPRHVAEAGEQLSLDYYIAYRRPFLVSSMHRHTRSLEGFVPLRGSSIFAVCPASEGGGLEVRPEPQLVQAFLVGQDRGVLLKPGVWHVAHFPLEEAAGYLIIKSACSGDEQDTQSLTTEVLLEL